MGTPVRAIAASACLVLAMTVQAASARGQAPSDRAIAESLFDEGRKLLDEGRLDEACAKLEASNRTEAAVGTLLNLGDCNERRGRLATAWGNYRAAASLALTRADSSRAEFAKKRAETVQPRLSTLTIVVAAREPGLRIKRDGVVVEDAAWGAPLPIDPGPHVIEAQAPGKKPWSSKLVIAEGAPRAASVAIEPLAAEAVQPAAAPPPADRAPPAATDPRAGGTVRLVGFIGLGAGTAAVATGIYFALHAKSVWADAEPHCDASNRCDDAGVALNHDARRSGDIATVAVTAGLLLVAAGTAAILLAPRGSTSVRPGAPSATPVARRSSMSRGITFDRQGMRFSFDVP